VNQPLKQALCLSHLADLYDPGRGIQSGDLSLCEIYFNQAADLYQNCQDWDGAIKHLENCLKSSGSKSNLAKRRNIFEGDKFSSKSPL